MSTFSIVSGIFPSEWLLAHEARLTESRCILLDASRSPNFKSIIPKIGKSGSIFHFMVLADSMKQAEEAEEVLDEICCELGDVVSLTTSATYEDREKILELVTIRPEKFTGVLQVSYIFDERVKGRAEFAKSLISEILSIS